jgi:hypothetical protein
MTIRRKVISLEDHARSNVWVEPVRHGMESLSAVASRISRREPVFRGASMADVSEFSIVTYQRKPVLASKGEVPDLLDQVRSDHDSGSEPM